MYICVNLMNKQVLLQAKSTLRHHDCTPSMFVWRSCSWKTKPLTAAKKPTFLQLSDREDKSMVIRFNMQGRYGNNSSHRPTTNR